MYKEGLRPAWVEIDLKKLDENIKIILSRVSPGSRACGIVKADAYGHSVMECVEVMQENGIRDFGVSTLEEAIQLREGGVKDRIIMLGLVPADFVKTLVAYDITASFADLSFAETLSKAATAAGKVAEVLAKVDTGMGRIGYLAKDPQTVEEILEVSRLPGLKLAGIFSHFSTADSEDRSFADKQEKRFIHLRDTLLERGVSMDLCTLANSPATMDRPSSHFDLCRPGGIYYGRYQSGNTKVEGIEAVMTVKAVIVQLKNVPEGFSVGYERSMITKRPSTIASLALGYADGVPRPWGERGQAIVGDRFAPFAGYVCMDQCMLDVTDVPNVQVGDEVILVGRRGDLEIRAEDIAGAVGTLANEITCGFSQRLPYRFIR